MNDTGARARSSARGRARILVVEDDLAVRELLLEILREEEYDVEAAVNGVEALDLLGCQMFDLVVSDLRMPKMDGQLLYREIRRRFTVPPRVVFVTGESQANGYGEFLAEIEGQVVVKPFEMATLVGSVQRALDTTLPR